VIIKPPCVRKFYEVSNIIRAYFISGDSCSEVFGTFGSGHTPVYVNTFWYTMIPGHSSNHRQCIPPPRIVLLAGIQTSVMETIPGGNYSQVFSFLEWISWVLSWKKGTAHSCHRPMKPIQGGNYSGGRVTLANKT